ncbi:hypothetical protein IFM89_012899 [Coptis chinensis]|uniref:Uncharacterized protein n=1 Tax=Coptis chinensis TaxID=261450 RepID=A0A835HCR5_9MAGN|nr:hypothetical protein IFM89_012899 [Coptis chinensis]
MEALIATYKDVDDDDDEEEEEEEEEEEDHFTNTTNNQAQPIKEEVELSEEYISAAHKPLSSLTQQQLPTPTTIITLKKKPKKKKPKTNSVWIKQKKGKKKSKLNTNTQQVSIEKSTVLLAPITRTLEKTDDSVDMKICLSKVNKAEKVELRRRIDYFGSCKGLPDGDLYAPKVPDMVRYKGQKLGFATDGKEESSKAVPVYFAYQ